VAADVVDRVERDGQRTFLRLSDDRRVPVGRSYRPDLKAAGWL
jgi:DNA-binding LytR/AlgR family response regulator